MDGAEKLFNFTMSLVRKEVLKKFWLKRLQNDATAKTT